MYLYIDAPSRIGSADFRFDDPEGVALDPCGVPFLYPFNRFIDVLETI